MDSRLYLLLAGNPHRVSLEFVHPGNPSIRARAAVARARADACTPGPTTRATRLTLIELTHSPSQG